jgi:protein-S-isoprenylcysteine O-methyltransferase Ste14
MAARVANRLSSNFVRIPMLAVKLILSVIANVAIFAALLFVPAGTLAWWRAWVFLGVNFIACSLTMFLIFRDKEDLLNERWKSPLQKNQPLGDKIATIFLVSSFFGYTIFIPLDVFRFHVMVAPGALISAIGLALFVAGWTIMSLSFKENAFAAPIVKHQAERQQRVIDSGVYSVVRHPMYAGAVPLMIGMPLWLGSYVAALLATIPIATLIVRIAIEEKFLRRELTGYGDYTKRVPYRLVPFVW